MLLQDNDEVGERHVRKTAPMLHEVAEWVKVVLVPDLPEHGDVTDWLDASHAIDELHEIVEGARFCGGHRPAENCT